jgi:hypothetical protein
MNKSIGSYAFIVGVVLAIVLGIASSVLGPEVKPILSSILIIMGIVVGFMNITEKETKDFLLTVAVLIIAVGLGGVSSGLGDVMYIGTYLTGIFAQLLAFIVPAAIVVCLKAIHKLAQD